MSTTTEKKVIRPYTMNELAAMYGVSAKTLRTWLRPHQKPLGKRESRYFTALQVRMIFNRLGEP